jgi:hypothetical protein
MARAKILAICFLGEIQMGELIVMPLRNTGDTENASAIPPTVAEEDGYAEVVSISEFSKIKTDFSVWINAPRERTAGYFPTYSTVSKAMQTAMRGWVREWFMGNMEILQKPHAAYALLVYQCTHPFSGRPSNIFTYEIQQTEMLNRAFRSAANKLGRYLKSLDTKRLPWFTREHYFAYRSQEVVKYVSKNPRVLYRMLSVETKLVDAILRFSIVDIPEIGLPEALARLRRTFKTQLHRFSEEFDLSPRSEQLLRIATQALVTKLAAEAAVQLPLAA